MSTSLVKTAPHIGRALVAAAALAVASCGGSTSDTNSSPSAADEAIEAPTPADDAVGADASSDVAAVRVALVENGDADVLESMRDEELDCIAEGVAANADLAAQVLADDFNDGDGAGAMARSLPKSCPAMSLACLGRAMDWSWTEAS